MAYYEAPPYKSQPPRTDPGKLKATRSTHYRNLTQNSKSILKLHMVGIKHGEIGLVMDYLKVLDVRFHYKTFQQDQGLWFITVP